MQNIVEILDNWSVGIDIVCCRTLMQKIVELLDNWSVGIDIK